MELVQWMSNVGNIIDLILYLTLISYGFKPYINRHGGAIKRKNYVI